MISAIVLAAGEAKRMGEAKLLLEWKGKVILEHVLQNLQSSLVDEVILVLGHKADQILEKVLARKIKIVVNSDFKTGMSSSIRSGLMALDKKSKGFFIVLGDQPKISKEILNHLICGFKKMYPRKKIVLPVYQGSRGHPVLFSTEYRQEALQLKGDVGARQILADHPEDILEIEMETDVVVDDLDTPEDYRRLLKQE